MRTRYNNVYCRENNQKHRTEERLSELDERQDRREHDDAVLSDDGVNVLRSAQEVGDVEVRVHVGEVDERAQGEELLVHGQDDGLHGWARGPALAHVGISPAIVAVCGDAAARDEALEGGGGHGVTVGLVLRNLIRSIGSNLVNDVLRDRAGEAVHGSAKEQDSANVLSLGTVAGVDVKVHSRFNPSRDVKL